MGHPSQAILQKLCHSSQIQLTNKDADFLCHSCQLGKNKRLPFQPSTRVTTTPLELIHIWGPSPTVSHLVYRYYIVFIDDFSKFHWIYPMTTRDESTVCFQHFKQLNENLLSFKINSFQTYGALELVKGSLRQFLDAYGISVCASCPHIPQQNGVAERKHRHITEIGNTMAFQACMPKSFWYDSFLTATFIINRTPSKLLAYKTPFEVLFHKKPDLSVLKVFGCTCYPFLGPYKKDKLSPKSSKYTFISYSPMHKGYKCHDNTTKKIFTTRHVVFEETSFPFCSCTSTSTTPTTSFFYPYLLHMNPQTHLMNPTLQIHLLVTFLNLLISLTLHQSTHMNFLPLYNPYLLIFYLSIL